MICTQSKFEAQPITTVEFKVRYLSVRLELVIDLLSGSVTVGL